MKFSLLVFCILVCISCSTAQNKSSVRSETKNTDSSLVYQGEKIIKTDLEWRSILSEESYHILREKGTEYPYTSSLLKNKRKGIYYCAACELPLFYSESKFESGCGWPSYFEPVHARNVTEIEDRTHGMIRTEIQCSKCGGHLGHVFDDGPPPTGLRYCINGDALKFKERQN